MNVIGICGSPRHGGNTETLLTHALDIIGSDGIDTRLICLAGKTISPCTACMGCGKEPNCVIEDDFQDVYQAMVEADGIIVGSPVYFGSATPEMMALLDRAGYVARRNGNPFNRKVGGPIVVARRAGQNFTLSQLMFWYMINGMVVPGSSYWNGVFGRERGEAKDDAEGMAAIETFARNIAWLLSRIGGG